MSITTADPGPVGSTNASPCPTSQATKTSPPGGQPEVTDRIGIWTISAVAAMATSGIRRRGRQARAHMTPTTARRLKPPTRPVGHGNTAPGSAPNQLATQTSQRQGNPANTARNWPNGIRTGAVSAAPNPAIVAAATTGSARTLAGIATRLTVPEIAAITGAVTR